MGRSRLAIVVPVRNEEKTIKKVIFSLKKYGDILIVNDSSTDRTSFIIQNLSIKFITNNYDINSFKGFKELQKLFKYLKNIDNSNDKKVMKNKKSKFYTPFDDLSSMSSYIKI